MIRRLILKLTCYSRKSFIVTETDSIRNPKERYDSVHSLSFTQLETSCTVLVLCLLYEISSYCLNFKRRSVLLCTESVVYGENHHKFDPTPCKYLVKALMHHGSQPTRHYYTLGTPVQSIASFQLVCPLPVVFSM